MSEIVCVCPIKSTFTTGELVEIPTARFRVEVNSIILMIRTEDRLPVATIVRAGDFKITIVNGQEIWERLDVEDE